MISHSPRTTVSLVGFDPDLPPGRLNLNQVIFLDIDGVLHHDAGERDDYFCYMDNFVQVMRAVDPAGEVPIVISSQWRYNHTVAQMRVHFPADIARQIVGVTPDLLDDTPDLAWAASGGLPSKGGVRQREIKAWMQEFAPAGDWLAIDDRPSYFQIDCPHLFCVEGEFPDEGAGLNDAAAQDLQVRLRQFLHTDSPPQRNAP